MKTPVKIVKGTVAIAALASLGALVLPLPSDVNNWVFRRELIITLILTLMYCGAAMLFLTSLKSYKEKMRRAFTLLSAGILVIAIGTIQLPVIQAFDLNDSAWSKSGMVILPFLLSGLLIYFGIRGFAVLVGRNSVLTKAPIVVGLIITLSFASILLPHAVSTSSELELDVSNALLVWTSMFDLITAVIIFGVKKRIGGHYTSSMAWLFAALIGSVGVVAAAIMQSLLAVGSDGLVSTSVNIAATLTGILYLKAGYAFTQTEDI